ncbi:hypothetical protein LXL04_006599 [Taraxacum kok-saghyz]
MAAHGGKFDRMSGGGDQGAKQEDFLYDHFSEKEEFWFDFMAYYSTPWLLRNMKSAFLLPNAFDIFTVKAPIWGTRAMRRRQFYSANDFVSRNRATELKRTEFAPAACAANAAIAALLCRQNPIACFTPA